MKQLRERPLTAPTQSAHTTTSHPRSSTPIALWRLNLLRAGYLLMGGGLAVVKWPLLLDHRSWTLEEGTIECLLVAMSLLALLGLRYPLRMLPIIVFEAVWKLLWLGIVALPAWVNHDLEGATRTQASTVLWVVPIIAVIPWRHVLAQLVTSPADPWRRRH